MKLLSALICLHFVSVGAACAGDASTMVTFDDLSPGPSGSWALIQNGYGNLQWNNFGVINGSLAAVTEGYWVGTVSPSNVAFNLLGNPAGISSATLFDLNSAYLTEAFANGMQLEVQGFLGATLIYDNNYSVNTAGPTLINFNYLGVDRVKFIPTPSSQFVMDNLITTVPEPNTLMFWSVGAALGFLGVLRRKLKCGERA